LGTFKHIDFEAFLELFQLEDGREKNVFFLFFLIWDTL